MKTITLEVDERTEAYLAILAGASAGPLSGEGLRIWDSLREHFGVSSSKDLAEIYRFTIEGKLVVGNLPQTPEAPFCRVVKK